MTSKAELRSEKLRKELAQLRETALNDLESRGYRVRGKTPAEIRKMLRQRPVRRKRTPKKQHKKKNKAENPRYPQAPSTPPSSSFAPLKGSGPRRMASAQGNRSTSALSESCVSLGLSLVNGFRLPGFSRSFRCFSAVLLGARRETEPGNKLSPLSLFALRDDG